MRIRPSHLCVMTAVLSSALPRPVAAELPATTRPGTVRVAGIVMKWVRGEKALNYRRAEPLIREAAARGAEIVVTTECFLDGYAIRDKSISDEDWKALCERLPDGEYVGRLRRLASELRIHLIAGFVECDGDRTYNTAVLIDPDGRLVGRYRKHDLEHELWRNTPGDAFPVFETRYGRIGLIICADRRNPRLVQRIAAEADLLICPSGGMWGPERNDHHVQARSRETGLPIVFVHPIEFLITGPEGEILDRHFLGEKMDVKRDAIDGPADTRGVLLFDLPLERGKAGPRTPATRPRP